MPKPKVLSQDTLLDRGSWCLRTRTEKTRRVLRGCARLCVSSCDVVNLRSPVS